MPIQIMTRPATTNSRPTKRTITTPKPALASAVLTQAKYVLSFAQWSRASLFVMVMVSGKRARLNEASLPLLGQEQQQQLVYVSALSFSAAFSSGAGDIGFCG
eukprot:TRINITY_DN14091_c0_g1_i1.p2 TRINITY_DN14091_c0_g1~~TRINITY_DN14091_c0_g1_i1.p2  ORF type:complete len:103 (-),score=5.32 TRINITY_DN14091_c0_g1_i1:141-449(-)